MLVVALVACGDDGGGDGPLTDGNVTVAPVELPYASGQTTAVDFKADGALIAISDGQLVEVPADGGAFVVINPDPEHVWMAVSPDGFTYTATATELRTYAPGATTPVVAPIDPAGPLATNQRVEAVRFAFSPTGAPLVVMTNNFPDAFAYRSDDHGVTWTPVPLNSGRGNVIPYGGDVTYAGNGDLIVSTYESFDRSTDGGQTWTRVGPAPRASYGGRLLARANGELFHYPPGGGGLQKSMDGGATWTELTPFNMAPLWTEVIERSDGTLLGIANRFSGGGGGIPIRAPMALYESTDGGTTWTERITANAHDIAAAGDRVALGLGWPTEDISSIYGGVFQTFDRGASWIPSGFARISSETFASFTWDTEGRLLVIANNMLLRRTDAGWRALAYDRLGLGRVAVAEDGTIFILRRDTTYFSIDDGASWTHREPIVDRGFRDRPVAVAELYTNDELLVSYLDEGDPPNGILIRIDRRGETAVPQPGTILSLLQMRGGTLYAEVDDVPTSRTAQSFDGGVSFSDTQKLIARDFNGADRYLTKENNTAAQAEYVLVGIDGAKQVLALTGLPHAPYLVDRERFAPDDTLVLMSGSGLFESTAPVR